MHVFALTIDHRYISRTFLMVTVQSKVAGVKLLKHAPAMGQFEAALGKMIKPHSKCWKNGLENALF